MDIRIEDLGYTAASPVKSETSCHFNDQLAAWNSKHYSGSSDYHCVQFIGRNVLDVPNNWATRFPSELDISIPDEGPVPLNHASALGKLNHPFDVFPSAAADMAHAIAVTDALDNHIFMDRALWISRACSTLCRT